MGVCHLAFQLAGERLHSSQQTDNPPLHNIYLSQHGAQPTASFLAFRTDKVLTYGALCDDFGPMNALSVFRFVEMLDMIIDRSREVGRKNIVYMAEDGPRAFTNAAFLLGAYLILRMDKTAAQVEEAFSWIEPDMLEGYRDATYFEPDFRLQLIDCWGGLHCAKGMGWISCAADICSSQCALVNKDFYQHYDNPLNANLHVVVPGKFVAFRGPKELGGKKYVDHRKLRMRDFSPSYFVDIFRSIGVTTVIRLNEPQYHEADFTENGIAHHDLFFEHNSPPPPQVIARFFEIVDSAEGCVAIHCGSGLGRTATLIALYMMRSNGFTAREAMGWLRIMRPGSVIGEQQTFLCRVEQNMQRLMSGRAS